MAVDIIKARFGLFGAIQQAGFTNCIGPGESFTSISFTVGAYTLSFANLFGARNRGALATNTTPVGFNSLYAEFIGGAPGPFTFSVSGLTASTNYDLRCFAFDKNNPTFDFDFVDLATNNSGSVFNTVQPTTDFEASVVVRAQSNSSGVVNMRGQRNSGVGFPVINAFIVSTVDSLLPSYKNNHGILLGC